MTISILDIHIYSIMMRGVDIIIDSSSLYCCTRISV